MALVQILICPGEAVLDGSALGESVLVAVDNLEDPLLKAISHELGYDFENTVQEGNRAVVANCFRNKGFRDQSDQRTVNALNVDISLPEVAAELVKYPSKFKKKAVKTIWAGCLVNWDFVTPLSISSHEKGDRKSVV